jgi:WD40 repeat protein
MFEPVHGTSHPGVERLRNLRGSGSRITPIAWSPDGSRLAAGCSDNKVLVWTVDRDISPVPLTGCNGPVRHVAWSPDGCRLAANGGKLIRIWRFHGDRFEDDIDIEPGGKIVCIAWSIHGEILRAAVITGEGKQEEICFIEWDAGDGSILATRKSSDWKLSQAGISNDRRWLALSLTSDVVEIWRMETGERIAALSDPYRPLFSIAVSPDLQRAILSDQAGAIRIWDLVHCRSSGDVQIHAQAAYSLAFSSEGRILASKSHDGTLQFRRCDTWDSLGQIEEVGILGAEPELAFRPQHSELATFDEKNTAIRRWKIDIPTLMLAGGKSLISILFLSAEPTQLQYLRIGEEVRKIQQELKLSNMREQFYLETHFAVRPEDLTRSLLELRPQIVTFSGHGSQAGEIILENESGQNHPVPPEALAAIFKVIHRHVQCVILNACYSKVQAEALVQVIPYVIGMPGEILDDSAIAFSLGFYQALGAGCSIPDAYDAACAQIQIKGISQMLNPILLVGGADGDTKR